MARRTEIRARSRTTFILTFSKKGNEATASRCRSPNIRPSGATVCTLSHFVGVGKHRHDEVAIHRRHQQLALAQAGHDEHHTRGKGSTARPRRNLVALLQLGFDLTDLEKALVAGIGWRFDENVE